MQSPNGLPLEEQQKLRPEEHDPVIPNRPAAHSTRTPARLRPSQTTPMTTTSSTEAYWPVPTDQAVDVEHDVQPTTTTQGGIAGVIGQSSHILEDLSSSSSAAPSSTPSTILEDAANLVQPGIQPDSSSVINPPVNTIADGAVIVEASSSVAVPSPSSASESVSSAVVTATTQEATPENLGALGQPGIQPEAQTSKPAASRIADGAAVIVTQSDAPSKPTVSTFTASIGTEISKLIVMGRMSHEDTDWVDKELPDWQNAIYYVDLPENTTSPTGLRTKVNKAREAMPYLTYIIDNYPIFPDVIVFMHPHKDGMPHAWHTDAVGHNSVNMLHDLQLGTVIDRGYVNLRCNNEVGCPEEIVPFRDPPQPNKYAEQAFPIVYSHFFNASFPQMREEIPVVATQCCAQFAVSSAKLGKRPKEDYEMYRAYLEETQYSDATIGRVMEYMW